MNSLILKKITLIIIIFSLILSSTGIEDVFVLRASAQAPSFGEILGKATAAATVCFLENKVEMFVAGLLGRVEAMAEGAVTKFTDVSAVPVIDTTGIKTSKSIETAEALSLSKKCLRDTLAKLLLDWLVDQTINWIAGGPEPKFVTNWDTFLEDAYQAGVGTAAQELGAGFLCEPFDLSVRLALSPNLVPTFSQRVTCTLDDILSNVNAAYEDFINDFQKGSWIAYNAMWQPQNNYYGTLLMAWDEMEIEGAKRKEAAQAESIASQGFLSTKKCIMPGNKYEVMNIECKGIDIASPEYAQCVQKAIELTETKYCKEWEITTPGKTIGGVLSKAVESDLDFIVNAQELSTYLTAIIDAAINRLVNSGVEGLRGL